MSAIKELLGKEAHELTDEELSNLLRGNIPRPPTAKKTRSIKALDGLDDLDIDLDDFDLDDLGNEDFLGNLSLEDLEERS